MWSWFREVHGRASHGPVYILRLLDSIGSFRLVCTVFGIRCSEGSLFMILWFTYWGDRATGFLFIYAGSNWSILVVVFRPLISLREIFIFEIILIAFCIYFHLVTRFSLKLFPQRSPRTLPKPYLTHYYSLHTINKKYNIREASENELAMISLHYTSSCTPYLWEQLWLEFKTILS